MSRERPQTGAASHDDLSCYINLIVTSFTGRGQTNVTTWTPGW